MGFYSNKTAHHLTAVMAPVLKWFLFCSCLLHVTYVHGASVSGVNNRSKRSDALEDHTGRDHGSHGDHKEPEETVGNERKDHEDHEDHEEPCSLVNGGESIRLECRSESPGIYKRVEADAWPALEMGVQEGAYYVRSATTATAAAAG